MTVTENGRRRKVTLREAITSQLINQSASADLRATKMLLDLIKDAERQTAAAGAAAPEPPPPFTKADEEVVATLIERLRHQILTEMKAAEASSETTEAAPAPPSEE